MFRLLPVLLIATFLGKEVQAQCDAAFNASVNGSTVYVWAIDSTPNKIHLWYFGDSSTGFGPAVQHTYGSPGNYQIWHILIDSINNCFDTARSIISISSPATCAASFVVYRDSTQANSYRFLSTSTLTGGSFQSYNWTVDGISVSNAFTFTDSLSQGLHYVCLTIQTTTGCTSTACDSISIVDSIPHCNLSASFIGIPDSNSTQITFFPTPADSSLLYFWHFGDGQSSHAVAPVHTYSSPGTYLVTLIVADSATNCIDSVRHYFYVHPIPPQDSCMASYTYTANPSRPNKITFTAISNDSIVSQRWFITPCDSLSFHDSVVYNIPNPTHTFTSPGCYRVCLTVVTSSGCRRTYCNTINIPVDSSLMRNRASFIVTFPNPAYEAPVNISLDLDQAAKVKLTVYNSFGNLVHSSERGYTAGNNRISIPVDKLQRGMYYVDLQYGNTRKRSTFQKL